MGKRVYYFEMVEGKKYYDEDSDSIKQGKAIFYIVPKRHYDRTKHLDDGVGRAISSTIFSLGFYEWAEAMYQYKGENSDGRKKLLGLGFVEKELGFGNEF